MDDDDGDEVAVLDAELFEKWSPEGTSPSDGNGSPGASMYLDSEASCFCSANETLELGFMTPTIWKLMHDPGALQ